MRFFIQLMFLLPTAAMAQNHDYNVNFSWGKYSAPDIKRTQIPSDSNPSKSKTYFDLEFTYQFNHRLSLTSGFLSGIFNYFEDTRSNAWEETTKYTTATSNARGQDFHAFTLVNYSFLRNSKRVQIIGGTGVGIFMQTLKYPYREPCSSGCSVFIGEYSTTSVEFPLRFSAYFLVAKKIGVGLTCGGFIDRKFNVFGGHLGPIIKLGF